VKGRLKNLTRGLDGEYQLTIGTFDKAILDTWDELHENDVNVEIKKFRRRRSLDANAYAWVLIDKLAEKMNRSKVEIYREAIRGIGGTTNTVCVVDEAVDRLVTSWQRNGLGWFADVVPSKLPGCTNVVLYYGSSSYDSKQMASLIDHIVQDCQALGIETLTPQEIAAMNEQWGQRERKNQKE